MHLTYLWFFKFSLLFVDLKLKRRRYCLTDNAAPVRKSGSLLITPVQSGSITCPYNKLANKRGFARGSIFAGKKSNLYAIPDKNLSQCQKTYYLFSHIGVIEKKKHPNIEILHLQYLLVRINLK